MTKMDLQKATKYSWVTLFNSPIASSRTDDIWFFDDLTGWLDGRLIGGVRFTAIKIGEAEGGALLGPLIVDPAVKGKGYGRALVGEGLSRARDEDFSLVLLVGDMPYYAQFGFAAVPPGKITLPGPVDPDRLLAVELKSGVLASIAGQIRAHPR